ncbi:MAG: hypothetical protein ACRDF4_06925, partial [Rhabdochlamydiaceae bacterium]
VEDASEAGTQAAVKAAQEAVEESVEEEGAVEMQNLSQQPSTQASKADAPKDNIKQTRFTSATTQAFIQTLMSSNVIPEALAQSSWMKDHAWVMALVTLLIELTVMAGTIVATPTSGAMNGLQRIGGLTKLSPTVLKIAVGALGSTAAALTDIATIVSGYNELEQSRINKKIAPLQALTMFEEGFFQIMTQLTSNSQQTYKQSMNASEALFNINFSSDMRACVVAQQYLG